MSLVCATTDDIMREYLDFLGIENETQIRLSENIPVLRLGSALDHMVKGTGRYHKFNVVNLKYKEGCIRRGVDDLVLDYKPFCALLIKVDRSQDEKASLSISHGLGSLVAGEITLFDAALSAILRLHQNIQVNPVLRLIVQCNKLLQQEYLLLYPAFQN